MTLHAQRLTQSLLKLSLPPNAPTSPLAPSREAGSCMGAIRPISASSWNVGKLPMPAVPSRLGLMALVDPARPQARPSGDPGSGRSAPPDAGRFAPTSAVRGLAIRRLGSIQSGRVTKTALCSNQPRQQAPAYGDIANVWTGMAHRRRSSVIAVAVANRRYRSGPGSLCCEGVSLQTNQAPG